MLRSFLVACGILVSSSALEVIGNLTTEVISESTSKNTFPLQADETDTDVSLNTTSGYSASAAVNWGNSYCNKDSEWLCAEFVARALNQGGMFPGVSDYGNYNGYNLRYVPDLHKALLHYGWSASSSGQWCGSAGQVRHFSTYQTSSNFASLS